MVISISDELRRYIEMVLAEDASDQIDEMANLGLPDHGIEHVIIHVGKANKRHGLRVKVSNLKDRWSSDDNFVIMLPSLDYDPHTVAKWIQGKVMKQILQWIVLNAQVLHDFENDEITLTRDFLDRISKLT